MTTLLQVLGERDAFKKELEQQTLDFKARSDDYHASLQQAQQRIAAAEVRAKKAAQDNARLTNELASVNAAMTAYMESRLPNVAMAEEIKRLRNAPHPEPIRAEVESLIVELRKDAKAQAREASSARRHDESAAAFLDGGADCKKGIANELQELLNRHPKTGVASDKTALRHIGGEPRKNAGGAAEADAHGAAALAPSTAAQSTNAEPRLACGDLPIAPVSTGGAPGCNDPTCFCDAVGADDLPIAPWMEFAR